MIGYPLITLKGSDFQLFKQVVELMQRREHLTIEGLNKYYQLKRAANFSMPESAHCIKWWSIKTDSLNVVALKCAPSGGEGRGRGRSFALTLTPTHPEIIPVIIPKEKSNNSWSTLNIWIMLMRGFLSLSPLGY